MSEIVRSLPEIVRNASKTRVNTGSEERNLTVLAPQGCQLIVGIKMKRVKFLRLGGATLSVTLVTASILGVYQNASAQEGASANDESIVIIDGSELIGTPVPLLPPPPREESPGANPPIEQPTTDPTPEPTETPIYNWGAEPTTTPIQAPREDPIQRPEAPQKQADSQPASEVVVAAEASSKPKAEKPALVSKPVLISAPMITVSAPLATGSAAITPAAKASLAKTAEVVKTSSKPVSISVKTTGTTVSKATAQANAIVAELKKSGVAAVTVIKRVGNRTSVSVLVTKKKP